jgi:hypothetical protein
MPDIIDQDRWGICGFVSVLNGLRTAGLLTKLTGSGEREMTLEELQTQLYAEIVTYLKYLMFTKSPLVQQIEEISFHLAPQGAVKRNVQELIRYIETRLREIAGGKGQTEETIRARMRDLIKEEGGVKEVTIAMTPEALVGYMEWADVKNAQDLKVVTTQNTGGNLLTYRNCVIGIGKGPGIDVPYNGLEHWIYVDSNGVLNNWGKKTTLKPIDEGVKLFGDWAIYITHVIKMG